jgi:hypothetical protein
MRCTPVDGRSYGRVAGGVAGSGAPVKLVRATGTVVLLLAANAAWPPVLTPVERMMLNSSRDRPAGCEGMCGWLVGTSRRALASIPAS